MNFHLLNPILCIIHLRVFPSYLKQLCDNVFDPL